MQGDVERLLRENGLQVTAQRLAILKAVSSRPHATADELIDDVREVIGSISRQAVFGTLNVMVEKNLIRRIQPAGSPARYEDRVGDNHHHLICRGCGIMFDIDCAVGEKPCLTADDDHGFQLALGSQVAFGKTPGVDVFNAYGPLVIYVSALGRFLVGPLLGETWTCSLAWAAALSLLFVLVARVVGRTAGALAVFAGWGLLARFYKWYLWCIPLSFALLLVRWLEEGEERAAGSPASQGVPATTRSSRSRALALGLGLGLAVLLRPDVGVLCCLATAFAAWAFRRRGLGSVALAAVAPLGACSMGRSSSGRSTLQPQVVHVSSWCACPLGPRSIRRVYAWCLAIASRKRRSLRHTGQ